MASVLPTETHRNGNLETTTQRGWVVRAGRHGAFMINTERDGTGRTEILIPLPGAEVSPLFTGMYVEASCYQDEMHPRINRGIQLGFNYAGRTDEMAYGPRAKTDIPSPTITFEDDVDARYFHY